MGEDCRCRSVTLGLWQGSGEGRRVLLSPLGCAWARPQQPGVYPFQRTCPTCGGCRQGPGRAARMKRPHWARRELGEEHQSQLEHVPVAKILHSQAGSPCAESWTLPIKKKKAPRSHFSYSGCLPGPRAFPKGGQEGLGPLGEEKRGRRCLGMQGQL